MKIKDSVGKKQNQPSICLGLQSAQGRKSYYLRLFNFRERSRKWPMPLEPSSIAPIGKPSFSAEHVVGFNPVVMLKLWSPSFLGRYCLVVLFLPYRPTHFRHYSMTAFGHQEGPGFWDWLNWYLPYASCFCGHMQVVRCKQEISVRIAGACYLSYCCAMCAIRKNHKRQR